MIIDYEYVKSIKEVKSEESQWENMVIGIYVLLNALSST